MFVVAFATVYVAAQAAKVDLTGKWTFTVQTDAGTGEPTVTLKQEGEKLTGHYSSQVLGEADLTGTVKGQQIQFAFTANAQGTEPRSEVQRHRREQGFAEGHRGPRRSGVGHVHGEATVEWEPRRRFVSMPSWTGSKRRCATSSGAG